MILMQVYKLKIALKQNSNNEATRLSIAIPKAIRQILYIYVSLIFKL
jgi:hypothetical protein